MYSDDAAASASTYPNSPLPVRQQSTAGLQPADILGIRTDFREHGELFSAGGPR